MKKLVYLLSLLLIAFSCTKPDLLQIAQDNEEKLSEIDEQMSKADEDGTLTAELSEQLSKEWDARYEKTKQAYADYFKENINTPEGYELFSTSKWVRRMNEGQLEAVLNSADETFKATPAYEKQSRRLHSMKSPVVAGSAFVDIVSKDTEGNPMKLSDYVGNGNYVLLDFWASWCPPCRKEAPHLVSLYEEYKDKGFEIVGYSLDREETAWLKGIADLGLTWPQMSDCEEWESIPVIDYMVQGIPCTFLIGPDGVVIEKNLMGDELRSKLETVISEQ